MITWKWRKGLGSGSLQNCPSVWIVISSTLDQSIVRSFHPSVIRFILLVISCQLLFRGLNLVLGLQTSAWIFPMIFYVQWGEGFYSWKMCVGSLHGRFVGIMLHASSALTRIQRLLSPPSKLARYAYDSVCACVLYACDSRQHVCPPKRVCAWVHCACDSRLDYGASATKIHKRRATDATEWRTSTRTPSLIA